LVTLCEKLKLAGFEGMWFDNKWLDGFPAGGLGLDFFANRGGDLDLATVCEEQAESAAFAPRRINHLESRFRKPALCADAEEGLRRPKFSVSDLVCAI